MTARSVSFIAALALASAPVFAMQGPGQGSAETKTEPKLAPLTAATLAGKWTLTLQTGSGTSDSTLDLKADPKDAKKVTGTINSQLGEAQFQSGEVVDGKMTLSFFYSGGGNELTIAIVGTQQKDGSLAGTLSFGQGEIPWTAVRVKDASAPASPTTPTPAPAPATATAMTVTGKWTMSLEMQMGTATPTLDLTQQGEKITGSYEGRYGKYALTGTLKKNVIEFSFTMSAEGTDVVMAFKGLVAADFKSMQGDADMGGMGEVSWSAAPQKKF